MMRGIFGVATLALTGIIVANLAVNYTGVVQGLSQLDKILSTTYAAMLGYNPLGAYAQPSMAQAAQGPSR